MTSTGRHPTHQPYDRLDWRELAAYFGWSEAVMRRLVADEAWLTGDLPPPAWYQKGSTRTHWLFADVAGWRSPDCEGLS